MLGRELKIEIASYCYSPLSRTLIVMEKPAQTDYPIHALLRHRYSTIAFDGDRPLDPDTVGSLLEAARWSASCFNEQPWRFIVATKRDEPTYSKLFDCLVEANQAWAKNADLLIISVGKDTFTHNGNPNSYGQYDVGQAVTSLTLQGESMGLRVHQMGGFKKDQARATFKIPAGFTPAAAIAIGYPAPVESLDNEAMREREMAPRVRKSLAEIVFGETWEQGYF